MLARTDESRVKLMRLFQDCNIKQRQEIERFRQAYKERSEQLGVAKMERPLPTVWFHRGQLPMELLMPREVSQTTEVQGQQDPVE